MPLQKNPLSVTRCKLCASIAACSLPTAAERGLAGTDSFTRNPDICDACLIYDYTAKRRWGTLEQWSGLTFGLLIALLATPLVRWLYRQELTELLSLVPTFLRLPAGLVLVGIAIAIPAVVVCWLLTRVLLWFMVRPVRSDSRHPRVAVDAERYRWLAAWGEATGHQRFKRRMLKRATALGWPGVPQSGNVA